MLARVGIYSSLLICWVVAFEIGLQITSSIIPSIDRVTAVPIKQSVEDKRLGIRGNPLVPDHDARGFRNAEALNSADMVTLGDSHTYGTSVEADQSWPFVLSSKMDKTVYNISFGGYGPVESYLNMELALSLKPRLIIYGFYFGNDFYEAFWSSNWRSILDEFVPVSEVEAIQKLEDQFPISGNAEEGIISIVRYYLSENSKVYGLFRTAKRVVVNYVDSLMTISSKFDSEIKAHDPNQLENGSKFEGISWRTIITASYRNIAMNESDLRIRTGVNITKILINRMNSLALSNGIEFLVVLLPTKESVFGPRIHNLKEHPGLSSLIDNETALRRELIQFFSNEGIQFVDLLPALSSTSSQPYFESHDGHPNPLGHQIIAKQVVQTIWKL